MSEFVSAASIQAIAHSINVTHLSAPAAQALGPDVEYRLRELIQDAQKFARHARRTRLTTEDVNSALRLRNAEPLYGFSSKQPARFLRAAGDPDLFCVADPELAVEQVVEAPLPRPPIEVAVMPHWLFINGVQPATPENARLSRPITKRLRPQPAEPADAKHETKAQAAPASNGSTSQPGTALAGGAATEGAAVPAGPIQVQPPVAHLLSKELQLYLDRVVKIVNAATAAAAAAVTGGASAAATAAAESIGGAHLQLPAALPAPTAVASPAGPPASSYYWGALPPPSAPGSAAHPGTSQVAGGAGASSAGVGPADPGAPGLPGVGAVERQLRAVLASIATDPGLHTMCPYLVQLLANSVTAGLACATGLAMLLRLAAALLRNEALGLEHYLHQLLPSLLTCMVAKGIGSLEEAHAPLPTGAVDHWAVRDMAAQLTAQVCARFGDPFYNIQPRIGRTLLKAFLDPSKPFATHYGAIRGLAALGPATVRLLLLPQLHAFTSRLAPLLPATYSCAAAAHPSHAMASASYPLTAENTAMDMDQQVLAVPSGGGRGVTSFQPVPPALQQQAVRVHAALVEVVGAAMHDAITTSAAAEAIQPGKQSVPQVLNVTSHQQDGGEVLGPRGRPASVVLANAWQAEGDLSEVLWAVAEVLGPAAMSLLPQPHMPMISL